ncbi:hypothetical protein J2749_002089 [Methanobacterium oryzae]
MKFFKPFLVLIRILGVIGIFGYLGSDTANLSSNYAITHA